MSRNLNGERHREEIKASLKGIFATKIKILSAQLSAKRQDLCIMEENMNKRKRTLRTAFMTLRIYDKTTL